MKRLPDTSAKALKGSSAGCAKASTLELSFSAKDIESIEMFQYSVPADAKKKTVTEEGDIQNIYEKISAIKVKENELEPVCGGAVSFRINIADDTSYELIYVPHSGMAGELTVDNTQVYQTGTDLSVLWDKFSYEAKSVDESGLPGYVSFD